MNELTIYQFKENPVRIIWQEDEPWFVAKDVCTILGLKTVWMALKALPDNEKGKRKVFTRGGDQEMLVISEAGRYRLTMRSNMSTAQPFQDWVCATVLPSIRKTGSYSIKPMSQLDIMQQAIDVLKTHEAKLNEHDCEILTIKADIKTMHQSYTKILSAPAQSLTQGQVLRAHINQYGREHNFQPDDYQAAWNKLYGHLFYRYGINIGSVKQRGGYPSKLTAAESNGCTEYLLSLATELFPIKSQSILSI